MRIDEHAVVRQLTGLAAGEYYYLLKELYSVAGLANANGALVEAYAYDAYGKVRVYTVHAAPCDQPGDGDGDCDVDMADFEALSLCYGPSGVPDDCPPGALARLDFNTNGVVDDADLEAFAAVVTGPQFGLFADGDWNSNGAVGPIDHNAFVNVCYSGPVGGFNTNGCQVFDFDGDLDVDLDDYGVLLALWYESSLNASVTLTAADASPVNDYYFTGRSLDFVPHGGERHQRYYYRARTYNTERFMQRDPLGVTVVILGLEYSIGGPRLSGKLRFTDQYENGPDLYEYVHSSPSQQTNPSGLQPAGSTIWLIPMGADPSKWTKESGCCGVDITSQLRSLTRILTSRFNSKSRAEKISICDSMRSHNGWDVDELFERRGNFTGRRGLCASTKGGCSDTVEVNGKCYRAGEVNYYLYGLGYRLCHDGGMYKLNPYKRWKAVTDVYIWRLVRTAPRIWHRFDASGRTEWVKAGWLGRLSAPRAAVKNCSSCREKYTKTLWAHIGKTDKLETHVSGEGDEDVQSKVFDYYAP